MCTWNTTEIETETYRTINRTKAYVGQDAYTCAEKVGKSIGAVVVDVDAQLSKRDAKWSDTGIDFMGVVYSVHAIAKCASHARRHHLLDAHYDAMFRIRTEQGYASHVRFHHMPTNKTEIIDAAGASVARQAVATQMIECSCAGEARRDILGRRPWAPADQAVVVADQARAAVRKHDSACRVAKVICVRELYGIRCIV